MREQEQQRAQNEFEAQIKSKSTENAVKFLASATGGQYTEAQLDEIHRKIVEASLSNTLDSVMKDYGIDNLDALAVFRANILKDLQAFARIKTAYKAETVAEAVNIIKQKPNPLENFENLPPN